MDRASFAQVIKVSPRTLAQLEDDPAANPTLRTLRQVFAPFGGEVLIVFPRLEPAVPVSSAAVEQREALRSALAKSRRRRRPG